jgi:subtilase family serine protease
MRFTSLALLGGILALCVATAASSRGGGGFATPDYVIGGKGGGGNKIVGYTPTQLRAAYGISGLGSSTAVVAIVDAYGYPTAASDLAAYRAQFGLPPCTVASGCLKIVNEAGSTTSLPKANSLWDVEQAIDLDMVSAICPNCTIVLVEANSASLADLAAAENTAAAMGAHVINNSYGASETGTTPYEPAYNHAGVAVTAAAGDNGYGVQFPATSPHVTAVGGTTLTLNGAARVSETVWALTGSGCSTVYAGPSWQASSNPNMANNTLCSMRMDNDVSAVADPATGVAVFGPVSHGSGWFEAGGTGVSAAIIAGVYGERNNAVVYGSNPYSGNSQSLHPITSGSNGACGGTYFCTAMAGYNGPAGLGTPNTHTAF